MGIGRNQSRAEAADSAADGRGGTARSSRRPLFGAVAIATLLFVPELSVSQPAPDTADHRPSAEAIAKPPEPEPVQIEGFRSARWGMDAAQVKDAIQKDFGVPADRVKTDENAAERTTILTTIVSDLLEGAGPARLSYVLGFKTKKLIQVTILWGTPVDPQAKPDKIVVAASQLRQLFLNSGYRPETVITNSRMADGTMLVFEGQDAAKHTTVLRLISTPAPAPAKGPKTERNAGSFALSLTYTLDSHSPDIFRLKRGQF